MSLNFNIKYVLKSFWIVISLFLGSYNLITSSCLEVREDSNAQKTQNTAVQDEDLVGSVEVSFKITEEGKADIISIKSDNPALIKYIKTKLNKIRLEKDDFNIDEIITYKLVFGESA